MRGKNKIDCERPKSRRRGKGVKTPARCASMQVWRARCIARRVGQGMFSARPASLPLGSVRFRLVRREDCSGCGCWCRCGRWGYHAGRAGLALFHLPCDGWRCGGMQPRVGAEARMRDVGALEICASWRCGMQPRLACPHISSHAITHVGAHLQPCHHTADASLGWGCCMAGIFFLASP